MMKSILLLDFYKLSMFSYKQSNCVINLVGKIICFLQILETNIIKVNLFKTGVTGSIF